MRFKVHSLYFAAAASLLFLAASIGRAQILDSIYLDMGHPFTVVNTTLPPGHYVLRMIPNTDLSAMKITSADGNESVDFLVRQSTDSHTPNHTDLIFDRYGNREFLKDVYERGDKGGVAVIEPSRAEERLKKEGKTAVEHTEEQSQ